ncbi:MAG TPA: glycoside hydrolase family 130 protein [Lentimicrobium sp.]|nr:glycoside hydrolase family 130 protein [Lentimicrobium sp.]
MASIKQFIRRRKTRIQRDTSRVILRPHIPTHLDRISRIAGRVLALSDDHASDLLRVVLSSFNDRHRNIEDRLMENFGRVVQYLNPEITVSHIKKMLIAAYFTMEYSIESAALFNPSIVPHPDQSNLAPDELRFIMSLRATGEGHISSIVFRSGIIESDGNAIFDHMTEFVQTPKMLHDPFYIRHLFELKLKDMEVWNDTSSAIIERLPDVFTYDDLSESLHKILEDPDISSDDKTLVKIRWLANSNYKVRFDERSRISERVIFPVSENESRGIEDARFVRFVDDNGEVTYYATYTAYNGFNILPQLIETTDFRTFNIITLNGSAVQNKGMALFPRKINGKFVMLGRQDGENNYIMFSDEIHFWHNPILLQHPEEPWEFVQVGNCGSPIELPEGWLLITHGVGAMRQYFLGALLLDLHEPCKVIARLREPLLYPNDEEREGYVPNVIYSCGSLIHNGRLIIPYAMSDITSGIVTVKVKDLLDCMEKMR